MRSLLIRCYPASWRARYGDEFESILDERPLGPFDVADILLGALDAQLRLRRRGADITHGRGLSMSLRIGGIAAILAAPLLALAWFLGYGPVAVAPVVPGVLLIAGLSLLLVAVAGLTAFQARMARTSPGRPSLCRRSGSSCSASAHSPRSSPVTSTGSWPRSAS